MKNLAITMTVKANSTNEAESIAMRELMTLARRTSIMGCGNGNATALDSNTYQVDANVQIDGVSESLNDIIREIQREWNSKANIISSMILVVDEPKPEAETEDEPCMIECDCCCELYDENEMHVINPDTESEMNLCDECFDSANNEGDIAYCDYCDSYLHVDNVAMNPVTKEYDLCPCCGSKINN